MSALQRWVMRVVVLVVAGVTMFDAALLVAALNARRRGDCWPCGNACSSDSACRTDCACSFVSGKCVGQRADRR